MDMDIENIVNGIVIFLVIIAAILVAVFFICREVFCWYWKINDRVDELKKLNKSSEALAKGVAQSNILLAEILRRLGGSVPAEAPMPSTPDVSAVNTTSADEMPEL